MPRVLLPPRLGVGMLRYSPIVVPGLHTYSTSFAANESPLSDGGAWTQGLATGLDWTNVDANSGDAIGTKDNGSNFDDSIACLSGFAANHSGTGIIHKQTTSGTMEVEILLRWTISAHVASGYECNLAHDASYTEIVRWNGATGSFNILSHITSGIGTVNDGDSFKAEVIGNTINVYHNGSLINTTTDNTFATGNPGIGFYRTAGAAFSQYAFSSFSATDI